MLNGVSEGLTERMERTCKTGQGPTLQNDLCEEKAHLWATSVPQVASIYKEAHLDFRLTQDQGPLAVHTLYNQPKRH